MSFPIGKHMKGASVTPEPKFTMNFFEVQVGAFYCRSREVSLDFLDRLDPREELLTQFAESTVVPTSFVSKQDVDNFISAGMDCGISSHVLVEKEGWIHTVAAPQQRW